MSSPLAIQERASGEIQVSEATATLLRPAFALKARGVIQVDGKGEMPTFLLGEQTARPLAGNALYKSLYDRQTGAAS